MASFKKVSKWAVIGSVWTAWWLFIAIYVTIPDYPYGVPIWQWVTLDSNGYLHEMFYIAVAWGLGYVTIWISSLLDTMNKILKGFLRMWEHGP